MRERKSDSEEEERGDRLGGKAEAEAETVGQLRTTHYIGCRRQHRCCGFRRRLQFLVGAVHSVLQFVRLQPQQQQQVGFSCFPAKKNWTPNEKGIKELSLIGEDRCECVCVGANDEGEVNGRQMWWHSQMKLVNVCLPTNTYLQKEMCSWMCVLCAVQRQQQQWATRQS